MRGLFVTGTDTDVGKTILSAALMAAAPKHVSYWKPVQTGCFDDDDTQTVTRLAGLGAERVVDRGVRLPLPASPHHAAEVDGETILVADLTRLAAEIDAPPGRTWIVEGAGGLLVPLSRKELLVDLVCALGLPVLVAASTRLGCINHTLLTVEALRRRNLPVVGIVYVGGADPAAESGVGAFAGVPVLGRLPQLTPLTAATVAAAGAALLSHPPLRAALACPSGATA